MTAHVLGAAESPARCALRLGRQLSARDRASLAQEQDLTNRSFGERDRVPRKCRAYQLVCRLLMAAAFSVCGCRAADRAFEHDLSLEQYANGSSAGRSIGVPAQAAAWDVQRAVVGQGSVDTEPVAAASHYDAQPASHRETEAMVPTPAMLETTEDAASPHRLPTSAITLADLEGIALTNNPAIALATDRIRAARGNWLQSGLPPNPVMGYVAEEVGRSGSAGMQGGFVGQQFVTGKKLSLNRQISAWQVRQAEQELETERLRVLTDVRTAYYDVLIAQRRGEVAANLVGISEQAVKSAEALYQGEEVSEADPLRARIEADRARIAWENSQAQLLEAWRRLAAVTGVPDMQAQRLEGKLDPSDLDISWQAALDRVLRESPEIAAAVANVESSRWAIRRACAEAIPNVEVLTRVTHDTATGETLAGLELGMPIPIINRNQGGVLQAQGRAAAAQRAVDRLRLDLQARLAAVFQRHDLAQSSRPICPRGRDH